MHHATFGLTLCLSLSVVVSDAIAADIYMQDFESNSAGVAGAGFVSTTSGYRALGFGDHMLRNWEMGDPAPSTLVSFNLLSAETAVVLDFDLAVIDSWDGNSSLGGRCCNTDLFTVSIDDNPVFSADFNNVWGIVSVDADDQFSDTQTFARDKRMIAGPIANLAGEWSGEQGFDSAYRLSVALGDLASGNHVIAFFAGGPGWQGGTDESFAIDNLRVHTSPVPVPPAFVLIGFALGTLGAGARRETRQR